MSKKRKVRNEHKIGDGPAHPMGNAGMLGMPMMGGVLGGGSANDNPDHDMEEVGEPSGSVDGSPGDPT